MGLKFKRFFTKEGIHPFSEIHWVKRSAVIIGPNGEEKFRQDNVECPDFYSETALAIIASKYLYGKLGAPERETSIKQLILRVADTIYSWGRKDNYFDEENGTIFYEELCYILVHQMASFNSPVWFNVGIYETPQTSACYILSVEDNMESILEWHKQEGMIFKYGSGAGINLSTLRSSRENLSSGGHPSGPIPFMRASDSLGGAIKSGGSIRRSAKLVCLDVDHPDIVEFIDCKIKAENQVRALREGGMEWKIGDDSFGIPFSNSNHAVRLTDEFMAAVENDNKWITKTVVGKKDCEELDANELMYKIANAVHYCADPGVMFHDIINKWHTAKNDEDIQSSNPCIEFNWINDSACNLASIRLTKFFKNNIFDIDAFCHVVDILITAQDILIDRSSYPSEKIKENSMLYRPLGLGYTDLGALLMRMGYPYDSDEGRNWAGSIASLMTARAYRQSIELAKVKGSSRAADRNKEHLSNVFRMHREHAGNCDKVTYNEWCKVIKETTLPRNMQVTLMAPTGTIAFAMDCDTTGIEPELALVKYKKMVGGGVLRIVNQSIREALSRFYKEGDIEVIIKGIEETGNIEDKIAKEYLPIFDCAFKPENGSRFLFPESHLKMMAAIQPAISGAISKTVNIPCETTVEQIIDLIKYSHKLNIKAVTFYRDGCKFNQPLTTKKDNQVTTLPRLPEPVRKKLPNERESITHKFTVGNEDGYLIMGKYSDGTLGEIFIMLSKEGSTIRGFLDSLAISMSIGLQYGVPLEVYVNKLSNSKFEPAGFTSNADIPIVQSVCDYIAKYLGLKFLGKEVNNNQKKIMEVSGNKAEDAPICLNCGNLMVRNGKCHVCPQCGESSGCS